MSYKLLIKIDDELKNLNFSAYTELIGYYSTYSKIYSGDSGIDIFNPISIEVCKPFELSVINFRIKCAMYDTESGKAVSYFIIPRSSLSNTDFMLANSIGLIDSGYRGNLLAKVRNVSFTEKTNVLCGRYFQIVSPNLSNDIKVEVVDSLDDTERGINGFGSTGN